MFRGGRIGTAIKIVQESTHPLTAKGVVHRVITNMAVFDVTREGLELFAIPEGDDVGQLRACTSAPFRVGELAAEIR